MKLVVAGLVIGAGAAYAANGLLAARRYGIDPSQIVSLNRIAAPYAIAPGQSLAFRSPDETVED